MSECHVAFTEMFVIFFSNEGKTEHVPEFKYERF